MNLRDYVLQHAEEKVLQFIRYYPDHEILGKFTHLELVQVFHENLSYHSGHGITPNVLERYLTVKKLLADIYNRPDPQPQHGDSVRVVCKERIHEDALILDDYYHTGRDEFTICMSASAHLHNIHQRPDERLSMSNSGGYFSNIAKELVGGQRVEAIRTFWFWGSTPCAHGGIYIKAPVWKWEIVGPHDFY